METRTSFSTLSRALDQLCSSTFVAALIILAVLLLPDKSASARKERTTKKVLIVVSNFSILKDGRVTGMWLEEFTTPYYMLKDRGVEITLASPKGGISPIDPKSVKEEFLTSSARRFLKDQVAQEKLNSTIKISAIKPGDYDAVFYPGGHSPVWDLSKDPHSIALIEFLYKQGRPVAFVCHSPAVLKNVKAPNGNYLVKGKTLTGFSNEEEEMFQSVADVPFLLETMMRERGANYKKGPNLTPYAVQDGNLITGQNPQSAQLVGEKLIAALLLSNAD